jgi:3-oxoacyl-[acyl-carrier protein] reductase
MTFDGKVALVTGSGGQGIGAVTARELAARGARVIVNYRNNQQRAETVVEAITSAGGQAHAIQADILDEEQVARLIARIVEIYGRLDILVSTKGGHTRRQHGEHGGSGGKPPFFGREGGGGGRPPFFGGHSGHQSEQGEAHPFQDHNPKERTPIGGARPFKDLSWEAFIERVNGELRAAFTVTKAVLPIMESQHYGRLVYVSSEHAKGPLAPGMISNGTAKAALNTFALYLAYELGPLGITANVVSPAVVQLWNTVLMQPPAFLERMASVTPLGRIALPEDIARAIAFFASDESAFMTGVNAPVTGGLGLSRL